MKYLAYVDIVNKSAQSIIGIALVIMGFKVVGIAANMAIISGLVIILAYWWLRPRFRIDMRTNLSRMANMTKESMAYWAFGLFGMIYFWIDTIMLTLMTRSEVVGWYGASTQLFQTLMFLPVLVQTAWLPRLVTAFVKGRRELVETARSPVELVLVISVPIAAGVAIVADPLIHAVYGPGFAQAVPVMIILALCVPPIYLNIILASVLLAAKRQVVWTIVMAGAAVVNPLFNLVLIPLTEHRYHNGAIGAAISLVLTELLMDIFGFFLVGRHVFDGRMLKRCSLVVLASGAMVGVALATRPLGMVESIAAGVATLVILVAALRIVRRDELALVLSGFSRVRARLAGDRASEIEIHGAQPTGARTQRAPSASAASRADSAQRLFELAASTETPDVGLCAKLSRAAMESGNHDDAYRWLLRAASGSGPFAGSASAAALLQKLEAAGQRPARREIRAAVAGSYTTSQFVPLLRLAALRRGIYLHLFEADLELVCADGARPEQRPV